MARLGDASIEVDCLRLRTLLPGEWGLIAETVLTGTVASVTFSNIPQRFRTLVLICSLRRTTAATGGSIYWRANGDTAGNYDYVHWYSDAAAGHASLGARAVTSAYLGRVEAASAGIDEFSPMLAYWINYTSSKRKWCLAWSANVGDLAGDNQVNQYSDVGHWRSTSVITSLTILPGADNLATGSRLTLYGVL